MHTVFTGNPQNLQKVPKIGGTPFFGQFFRKFPPISDPPSRVGGSKCDPPLWAILRGENRTFRQNLKIWDPILGGTSQNRVFRGGGHLTPCSGKAKKGQKRPKMAQKGGLDAILALCYRELSGPPSKKHGFGKFPPISDLRFSNFAQKCGSPPPLRMAQRGGRTSSHLLAMGGPI